MESTLAQQVTKVSKIRKFGRALAKAAISPFYIRSDKRHLALSCVNNIEKGRGIFGGLLFSSVKDMKGANVGGVATFSEKASGASVSGIVNITLEESSGFSFSGLNLAGINRGVQIGWIGAIAGANKSRWYVGEYASKGLVAGTLCASADHDVKGALVSGVFSYAMEKVRGAVIAPVNFVSEKLTGFSFGIYSMVESFTGFRIGLINASEKPSKGVEIGLLNINTGNPWYARVSPIIAIRLGKGVQKED
ncbi:MAG: hypothetical protein V1909_06225 [Candidatus Micrarchaeota archaeon]